MERQRLSLGLAQELNQEKLTLRSASQQAIADYYIMGHGEDPLYLPVTTYHLLQARVSHR